LANRFRISVRLTTPDNRPDMLEPEMFPVEAALLLGMDVLLYGAPIPGVVDGTGGKDIVDGAGVDGVAGMAGVSAGVGGPDDDGEGDSTTHILYPVRCSTIM